jgi:hypothetical protein
MTAEIIDFTTTHHRPPTRHQTPAAPIGLDDLIVETPRWATGPAAAKTATGRNARLRSARWEVWRRADAITNYWHELLGFHHAVEYAKRLGLKEALAHVEFSEDARWPILCSYREALGKQLLTPAPDVASVNWKRLKLRKAYGVKKELVEKAIADDIAFLDAHPARKDHANKLG